MVHGQSISSETQTCGDKSPDQSERKLETKSESKERGEAAAEIKAGSLNDQTRATRIKQHESGESGVTKDKFPSAKGLFGEDAHTPLTKNAEAKRDAEFKKRGWDSNELQGKPDHENFQEKYKDGSVLLKVNEPLADNTCNSGEKLQDFMQAAAKRATDSESWKAWAQGEINKYSGIPEGLNEAKEDTKAAVAAGWKALTDGTVVEFLSQPNAINAPVFKTIEKAFDAMSKDTEAVNKAFEVLGKVVLKASEQYSNLPNYEKGKVIGKAMFGMVNPEGSTEAAETTLKIGKTGLEIGEQVAIHVDRAVSDAIGQTVKSIKVMAPELAENTKQVLYDYIKSKGLTASELEKTGEIPKGFFDNLEKPHEGTALVGKGGDWPVLNERPSPDVVQQTTGKSCVAAVGEMLSEGALKQTALIPKVGTVPENLLEFLGSDWNGGFIPNKIRERSLDTLLSTGKSWGAELRDEFYHHIEMGHMVVVDGLDEAGNIMIRDPQHATRYEMTRETFMKHWSNRALFPTKPE
ncbi:MAG: hypothetical protein K2X81_09370 [Candidatus Obscuribacterales bacterium]|nr:hypothetical protein [Candidatus Obscuribacterales bacterium]